VTVSAEKVMSVVLILVNWCAVRQAWLVVTLIVFLSARAIVYLVVLTVVFSLLHVAIIRTAVYRVSVVLMVNAVNVAVTQIVL
jgi:hypothetical protein